MKILVFDNYDSFTYNLVHLVQKIVPDKVEVFRNDKISLEAVADYDKIILSPGPGIPKESGMMLQLIQKYAPSKSILGVCLGHQAIGEAFGGTLVNLSTVYHGVALPVRVVSGPWASDKESSSHPIKEPGGLKTSSNMKAPDSTLTLQHSALFDGLPDEFPVGRYHSWIINELDFPKELEITARDENGYIMALQHTTYDVQGVQFHPESILTPDGETILRNWLRS